MATITLDEEQRTAASAQERFVRVLAGAGTGKTTTLVARVRYLVQQLQYDPRQLCVLTFSKRAAEELARRCGPLVTGAFIGTIHSLGYRMLQFEHLARPVAEPRKCRSYVLQAMREHNLKESLQLVYSRITRARAFGQPYHPTLTEVGARYETILHDNGQYDFDDLLLRPVQLLGENEEVRGRWAGRYKHVLVDEAQDTSYVQWALIRYLIGLTTHLTIVGDVYQAIYTWRGADADGMLTGADTRFLGPGEAFKTYTVGFNYRSRTTIIEAANRTLRGKEGAVPLVAARTADMAEDGPVVSVIYDESVAGSTMLALQSLGQPDWHDVVILGRTRAALGQAESSCVRLGIPYVQLGGSSFYERSEVRDVLAYMEYALGLSITDALERVYNRPSRYLGKVWFDSLMSQGGWTQWEVVVHGEGTGGFRWPQRYMKDRAEELQRICKRLRQFTAETPAQEVIDYVLKDVGYTAWMRRDGVAEAEATEDNDAEDNLDALRDLAEGYTLARFLGFVDTCRRIPKRVTQTDGAVVLSTIHRAKGLEWPTVIVVGLEEGILPHHRGDPDGEERRLYYVAVTRPQHRLILALSGVPSPESVSEGALSRYVRETTEVLGFSLNPAEEPDGADEIGAAPAPQHEGDSPVPGDGGNDSRGAGGAADRSVGSVVGGNGSGGATDGLGETGGTDHGDLPGGDQLVAAARKRQRKPRRRAVDGDRS